MSRAPMLLGVAAIAALALLPAARAPAAVAPAAPAPGRRVSPWRAPAAAAPYVDAINEAEVRNGLPSGLLARVLYQESRFRQDIITGQAVSPAGAIGIAQFMPDTAAEYGVDPFDPWSSIDGAARLLADLYDRFGDWALALTAYNWGLGNVRRKGISRAPAESRAYASEILVDVNVFS